jgi:chromosome segregation ATPase
LDPEKPKEEILQEEEKKEDDDSKKYLEDFSKAMSEKIEKEIKARKERYKELTAEKENIKRELEVIETKRDENRKSKQESKEEYEKAASEFHQKLEDDHKEKNEKQKELEELELKKWRLTMDIRSLNRKLSLNTREQSVLKLQFENDTKKHDKKEVEIEKELESMKEKLNKNEKETVMLSSCDNIIFPEDTDQKNANNSQLLEFVSKSIEEKEKELECPVCFETAEPPIYMCVECHLVCGICLPRFARCPICRLVYEKPPRRHRFAEKQAEELAKLILERKKILDSI